MEQIDNEPPLVSLAQFVAGKMSDKLIPAIFRLRRLALPRRKPLDNAVYLNDATAEDAEGKLSVARPRETDPPIATYPVIQLLGTHFRGADV